MKWADSHCHLAMAEDAGALLDAARAAEVRGFLVPGTKLEDAEACIDIAREHEDVWAAVGFHPHEAVDCDEAAFDRIGELARDDSVVAIGEAGLDYYYDHSPREDQKRVLREHLCLARELDKPIIIHNRESTDDLLEILQSEDAAGVEGVLHSFTESYEIGSRLIDLGFVISFSGIVTFRSADTLRDAARRLPRDSIMVETDTPYLAPVPHRGKPNQPKFVRHTGELLAELWDCKIEEVARLTTATFERTFGVRVPG